MVLMFNQTISIRIISLGGTRKFISESNAEYLFSTPDISDQTCKCRGFEEFSCNSILIQSESVSN
jgi:hypothetical protein